MPENEYRLYLTDSQMKVLHEALVTGTDVSDPVFEWLSEAAREIRKALETTTPLTHPDGRAVHLPPAPEGIEVTP